MSGESSCAVKDMTNLMEGQVLPADQAVISSGSFQILVKDADARVHSGAARVLSRHVTRHWGIQKYFISFQRQ